jgi:hypothetical protein
MNLAMSGCRCRRAQGQNERFQGEWQQHEALGACSSGRMMSPTTICRVSDIDLVYLYSCNLVTQIWANSFLTLRPTCDNLIIHGALARPTTPLAIGFSIVTLLDCKYCGLPSVFRCSSGSDDELHFPHVTDTSRRVYHVMIGRCLFSLKLGVAKR